MNHTKTITLTEKQQRFANNLLTRETADPDASEVPMVLTAKFDGNIEADIKLCNGDSPYVDAVLFEVVDNCGHQVAVLDVSDELVGEYEFEHNGNTYVVNVVSPEEDR